jgi:hypothetical protein
VKCDKKETEPDNIFHGSFVPLFFILITKKENTLETIMKKKIKELVFKWNGEGRKKQKEGVLYRKKGNSILMWYKWKNGWTIKSFPLIPDDYFFLLC